MILNCSGHSDIVAFHTEWLMKRLREGVFAVEGQEVNNVYELSPQKFELIMFQTKNPQPILKYIPEIKKMGYKMIFIVTITPYDNKIEPSFLSKRDIIAATKQLSKLIGKNNVILKYAPIIINSNYSSQKHLQCFCNLVSKLSNNIDSVYVDFVSNFNPAIHNSLFCQTIRKKEKENLLSQFYKIANQYNIQSYSLSNNDEFETYLKKKANSLFHKECCLNSIDMGLPNVCPGGCLYCNSGGNCHYKPENIIDSPLYIGNVNPQKKIKHRRIRKIYTES